MIGSTLQPLPMPAGAELAGVLPRLRAALDGVGPAWLPVPTADPRERDRLNAALSPGEPIGPDIALVVTTSGSTGTPKGAMLSAAALRASGTATHARLGGSGQWLLALPTHHIAGIQVLLRSILAGTDPAVLDVSRGFHPEELAQRIRGMRGERRYTALVPTQLIKALNSPAATAALAELDAVLIGGAATPPSVYAAAVAAGIPVVRTYGMSETCGGCVYDGIALPGAEIRLDHGQVVLGGTMVASGYRGQPEHPAFAEPGWFRTDDAGVLDQGRLRILGRRDDAISTGGLLVLPTVVEAVLTTHPAVAECAVLGVPDERLGQRVAAAVVPAASSTPTLSELREHLLGDLDPYAAPRELLILDELPLRGPGKLDRQALRERFIAATD